MKTFLPLGADRKFKGIAMLVLAVALVVGGHFVVTALTSSRRTALEAEDAGPYGQIDPGNTSNAPDGSNFEFGPAPELDSNYYTQWRNGPPSDPSWFPIGVWLQDPRRIREGKTNGQNFKDIGINTFVGLWEDLQQSHLDAMPAGTYTMPGEVSRLSRKSDKVIGYVITDEPDMNLKPTYGGCMLPDVFGDKADTLKADDPTRPTYANFGKGFALPDYYGGDNCPWPGHDRDLWRSTAQTGDFLPQPNHAPYEQWAAVPDIVSVDHYSTSDQHEPTFNKEVWGYGRKMRRLYHYAPEKPGWAFIQVTSINDNAFSGRPSTSQVTSFVWYALINGARGIQYFVHSFNPLVEDALLADQEMKEHVKSVNADIMAIAPVLNAPTITEGTGVSVSANGSGLTTMIKEYGGNKYVLAIPKYNGMVNATFTLAGITNGTVEVVNESRTIPISGGRFSDGFPEHQHHIYKVVP